MMPQFLPGPTTITRPPLLPAFLPPHGDLVGSGDSGHNMIYMHSKLVPTLFKPVLRITAVAEWLRRERSSSHDLGFEPGSSNCSLEERICFHAWAAGLIL